MPNVSEGLREGATDSHLDPNTETGFQAALAASVGRGTEGPESLDERHNERQSDFNASGAQIVDYLENSEEYNDLSTSVKEGLTLADTSNRQEAPLSLEESERLTAARRSSDPSYQARLAQQDAQGAELDALRQQVRDAEAVSTLDRLLIEWNVYSREDLENLTDEERATLGSLWGYMSEDAKRYALTDGDILGEEEGARLGQIEHAIKQSLASQRMIAGLQKVGAANEAKTKKLVNEWVMQEGLTKDQAISRMQAANQFAERAGVDIDWESARDPQAGMNTLIAFDALAQEARRAEVTHRFNQEMLGYEGTSVADGMMVRAANGQWVRENDIGPLPPPRLDVDRAARRATPMTGEEVAATILGEDGAKARDIAAVYQASGIPERMAEEERLYEARSKGLG